MFDQSLSFPVNGNFSGAALKTWLIKSSFFLILTFVVYFAEGPGAQWTEGLASLLRHHHGDQPVLHHVHWRFE